VRRIGTVESYARALDAERAAGRSVGLVTTMGALHAGHRSLITRAVDECDIVAVTIFVNPLQFGEAADLEGYPRTLEDDLTLCAAAGASLVLVPTVDEMYPDGPQAMLTTVSVRSISVGFEGASRPGHFDGVATVVAKLFAMTGRCRAYFGEKDLQQLAVVRRMASDLSLPVEVVGCPTVRERDGLALSSRNARLSAAERSMAPVLWRALGAARALVEGGAQRPDDVSRAMAEVVVAEPLAALDYAAVVEEGDLSVPARLEPGRRYRLLLAARVGPVRLIDNEAATAGAAVGTLARAALR
jgi:pantoate--beta-alanine ligase